MAYLEAAAAADDDDSILWDLLTVHVSLILERMTMTHCLTPGTVIGVCHTKTHFF
jgi:hypothetical protein